MSIATDLQVHTNHTTTGPPLAAVLFGYDPVGNVASIEDGVAVQTQNFSYDALDRLESASASSGDGAYDEAYQYYRGGSIQRKGDPENTSDGLYDYADLEFHPHAVTGYRGNSYGYDANGNMTSRTVDGASYTLTYDAENRLIDVVGGGSTVTFTYDGDGNRVKKDEDGIVTHYPGRHYEATIGSGSTKYYYAGGQLVSFERSPEYGINYGRRFVFRDHLGSTSVIVNDKGEKLWEDRFYPFGDVRHTYRKDDDPGFPLQTQYRYTGQWFEDGLGANSPVTVDGEVVDRGLYFYGARWYDSYLNRWIQPDTVIPDPGDPQSLNRYSYAANNPLKYTDPSGHYATPAATYEEEQEIRNAMARYHANWLRNYRSTKQYAIAMELQENYLGNPEYTAEEQAQIRTAMAEYFQDARNAADTRMSGAFAKAFGLGALMTLGLAQNASSYAQTAVIRDLRVQRFTGAGSQGGGTSKTTLYRATSYEEYNQLMDTGQFETVGQSVEGKYFAEHPEHAAQWGDAFYGKGNYRVISVELTTDVANTFYRWPGLDTIGPARFATIDQLSGVPMTIQGLP